MRHSRQMAMRVTRAATGATLAGALVLGSPVAAFAAEGRGASAADSRPAERPPAADRAEETPASERAEPLVVEDQAPSDSTQTVTDPELPQEASNTATAATAAERSPTATAEAVLETTPSDGRGAARADRDVQMLVAMIEPASPVPMGDVTAAGAPSPVEIAAQPVPAPRITTQPASAPGGLALDPLVPASLGLLVLARLLRRKPSGDDRTYPL